MYVYVCYVLYSTDILIYVSYSCSKYVIRKVDGQSVAVPESAITYKSPTKTRERETPYLTMQACYVAIYIPPREYCIAS
jgi:hypothetical protein